MPRKIEDMLGKFAKIEGKSGSGVYPQVFIKIEDKLMAKILQ